MPPAPPSDQDTDGPLLRAALEGLPDGVVVWGPDLKLVLVNPGFRTMHALPDAACRPGADGIALLRLMARRGDLGPPEDAETLVLDEAAAIRAGAPGALAERRTAAGMWVEVTRRHLSGGNVLEIHRDISCHRAREVELEEARRRQDLVLEYMTDGVVLWDQEFRLVIANRHARQLGGFPDELSRPGTDIRDAMRFQDRRGDFGPPPTTTEELEERVARRAALLRQPGGVSYVRPTPCGQWVEVRTVPLPEGGNVLVYRDITALKRREAELAEAQALHELVLRTTSEGVLMLDAQFCVRLANAQAHLLLGLPEELLRTGADGRDMVRHMLRQAPEGAQAADLEAQTRRAVDAMLTPTGAEPETRPMPDGRWLEISRAGLPEGGVLVTVRDITRLKQREAQLEQERATQKLILDNMTDGVMLMDAQFRVRLANRQAKRFYDIPREVGRGVQPMRDILRTMVARGDFGPPPTDQAGLEAAVQRRATIMTTPGLDPDLFHTANGHVIEVARIPVPGGGILSLFRNVTRLKAREQELARARDEAEAAQRALATTIEHMSQGLLMFTPDGTLSVANLRAAELLQLPPELLRPGVHQRDILAFQLEAGDLDDLPELRRMAEEGRGGVLPPARCYERRQRRNGTVIEVMIRNLPDGGQVRTFTDITERKQAEGTLAAALAEAEAAQTALTTTLDHMAQGLLLVTADRRVRMMNRRLASMLELPPDLTRPGTRIEDIMAFQAAQGEFTRAPEVGARVHQLIAGAPIPNQDTFYERERPNGTVLEMRAGVAPDGGAVRTYTDITDRKLAERRLAAALEAAEAARAEAEAADRAKSTFLATMSHEIRTPMNGVLGMLEVLERSPLDAAQARCVTVMRESAGGLLRIIDDILDFSKIEAGRLELEALPFSLHALLEGAVDTLSVQARQKGVALAARFGPGPAIVLGDPVRVRQILFNLLGNAIKFTDVGSVEASAETILEADGTLRAVLVVQDTGRGMTDEEASRLFRPFAQADSSTTRRFGGTGLGLSIVRRLARLMGGDVEVDSAPGRGSRFTVTLRLGAVADAPSIAAPWIATTAPGVTRARLLVVDDHAVNREVLARQLALLGHEADMAENGAQGLEAWRRGRHPAVLVDLHMPVMDGASLARAIRREEARQPGTRSSLIACTANALKGEDDKCLALGFDAFLPKPVALQALERSLHRWLPGGEAVNAVSDAPPLFDQEALSRLFGADAARLAGLLRHFAESAEADAVLASRAIAMGDLAGAAQVAHRLKGACRIAGARPLAEAAAQLEAAGNAADEHTARTALASSSNLMAPTLKAIADTSRL